jgi:hypothetical protein
VSRFLAAFRARQAADAEPRIPPPYGADNPEYPENPVHRQAREAFEGVFRVSRDCRGHTPPEIEDLPQSATAPALGEVAARAAALLRFAEEAHAALIEREPDPIEDAERTAVFGGGGGTRHGVAVTEESFPGKGITQ